MIAAAALAVIVAGAWMAYRTGVSASYDSLTESKRHRAVAEWVVRHGGVVEVKARDQEPARYVEVTHLPDHDIQMTEINLYGQEFPETDLRQLRNLRSLEALDLSRTSVSDVGMKSVASLPDLKKLYLRKTRITQQGLKSLPYGSHIQTLSVSGSAKFGDAECRTIAESMPNLKTLLGTGTAITDTGLAALQQLKKLRLLDVQNTSVTEQGVADFQKAQPQCRIKSSLRQTTAANRPLK